MYIPKHFEITDEREILSFIEAHSFGQLISSVDGRPYATHMPFMLSDDKQKLIGHIAKSNPQHISIDKHKQQVLITLQGPHGYISPSWYTSAGVPTWNYQAVHIYGSCNVFKDTERLKHVVESLTNEYESGFEEPWKANYKASMLGAIIGLEVNIEEIQCQYKLSQNKASQDKQNVMEQLDKLGANELANSMRELAK